MKNFLQRHDVVKLLQGFNIDHLATRAEMLAQLITSVKLIHPFLEPTEFVGPCHHGMARPQVADGGTAYAMQGSCE